MERKRCLQTFYIRKKRPSTEVVFVYTFGLVAIAVKEEQQDNHDNDNPQKLIVVSIKKTIEQTHYGVPLSLLATAYAKG